jgi:5-methylcytosine-specific restriction endonuclease McrA
MKRRRKHIPLPEKLAAALSLLLNEEERTKLREKRVTAKTVISLFEFDHAVLHALGGADSWFNLTPTLKSPHREKSKRDTSIVAKVKRIERDDTKWRNLLRPKPRSFQESSRWPKRKIPSRQKKGRPAAP